MEWFLKNKRLPNAEAILLTYAHVASLTTTIRCTKNTAHNGQLTKELGLNPAMPAQLGVQPDHKGNLAEQKGFEDFSPELSSQSGLQAQCHLAAPIF